jgi:hypothetical protein
MLTLLTVVALFTPQKAIELLKRHPEWVGGVDYWKLVTGGLMVYCKPRPR